MHLDATEHGDRLIFLHTVKEGPANQSYGLQVAALAGVPPKVIAAARRYLHDLEQRSAATHELRPQQELTLEFRKEAAATRGDGGAEKARPRLDDAARSTRCAIQAQKPDAELELSRNS